ncbi:MAG: exodeoxyribonuclease III [Thioalkalivibrionaceae bacterium]
MSSSVRVMSFNANGLRAAARKGFFDWLRGADADVICVQETKAQAVQLADEVFRPAGYEVAFADAEKKGYSGVAIYSRVPPDAVIDSVGFAEADAEGRYLEFRFGQVSVVSLYLPSGSSGEHRQDSKWRFLEFFEPWLAERRVDDREWLICGDWNIAHREIDLKNWKSNQKNSGFLPEERAFLDRIFEQQGWCDVFRQLDPRPERYTWWSQRGQARTNNVGWRIDYHVATPGLAAAARATAIHAEPLLSDHAPLVVDYDRAVLQALGWPR